MNLLCFIFTSFVLAEMRMGDINEMLDMAYAYEKRQKLAETKQLFNELDITEDPTEELQSFLENFNMFSI